MKSIGELLGGLSVFNKREPGKNEYIGEDGAVWCGICKTPKYAERMLSDGSYAMIPCRCICEEARIRGESNIAEIIKREQVEALRKACIGLESYRGYRFEHDDNLTPEQTGIAMRYIGKFEEMRKKGWGIIFTGGVGSGKTFLALCIANALIDKGISARLTSPSEIVEYARDWDNAARHFNRLMGASCIVLDDLGTQSDSAFSSEQFFKFTDGAVSRKIPLIITTNLSLAEMRKAIDSAKDLYAARIYSRILGCCSTVTLSGIDRRESNAGSAKPLIKRALGELT